MYLLQAFLACTAAPHTAIVDPLLNRDMRPGLQLEVALSRIGTVVVVERAFDVDGMGVVPFDKVAIVTVHGPDEVRQGFADTIRQAVPEPGRTCREFHDQIGQRRPVVRRFADEERLHPVERLASVG